MSYYRVQFTPTRLHVITPAVFDEGTGDETVPAVTERRPLTNQDGTPVIQKTFVWELHNVHRLFAGGHNIRVSVRKVLLKREEPTDAEIEAAANEHVRLRNEERAAELRRQADELSAAAQAAAPAPAPSVDAQADAAQAGQNLE